MSGNAATGIRSADQFKNREPSQRSISCSSAAKAPGPLIKESFANAFRKSVRTAGVVADAHPCLPASTRGVDRLGRIAGHAERERYYNVYLRYYFSAGRTPSLPSWFCRRAGFSRGLCEGRRGACAAVVSAFTQCFQPDMWLISKFYIRYRKIVFQVRRGNVRRSPM